MCPLKVNHLVFAPNMLLPPGAATLLVSYAIILVNRGNVKAKDRRTLMAVAQATLTVRRKMTEGKFLRLPDAGRKWELVNGEAREVPAGHRHDAIGIQVAVLLKPHTRGRGASLAPVPRDEARHRLHLALQHGEFRAGRDIGRARPPARFLLPGGRTVRLGVRPCLERHG